MDAGVGVDVELLYQVSCPLIRHCEQYSDQSANYNLLLGIFSVMFLLVFVSRSKLVPDFALTIHFLHLIATTLYTHSLPSNLLWWGLQFTSAAMMIFLGMWACQRRELEPIKFGGHRDNTQAGPSSQASAGDGQQESSFGRGRGRERSLQEYEMDDIKHTGEHAV